MTNAICFAKINLNKAGICRRADIYAFGTVLYLVTVKFFNIYDYSDSTEISNYAKQKIVKKEIINEKNNKRGDRGINAHSFGIVHCYVFSAEINNAGGSEQIKVFVDAASQA